MRISTSIIQQRGVNALLDQQAKLSKTQLQLSSGKRLLTPAEDPAAAVRSLDLNESLKTHQQYQSNMDTARNRLAFEDTALEAGGNVLQRARELTVQSLNDTLNGRDRQAIAEETQLLLDQLTGLANSRNANGEYLFSGYRSDTVPFAFDDTRTPPSYVYAGDKNRRQLQIGDSRTVADGDSGWDVFENVPSASGGLAVAAAGGRQNILNTLHSLTEALKGEFTASHGAVLGSRDLTRGIDYSGGPRTFDLAIDGGLPVSVTIPAGDYATADELAAAINTGIAAGSLNGRVVAQTRAGFVEFASTAAGAASAVTIDNDAEGVLTDLGFDAGQTGSGAAVRFHDAASAALTDIDAAIQRMLDTRADVGARLNALDVQTEVHEKFIEDTTIELSELQDLDYVEAITRFTQQETALQAAQQAYVRVQKLSLFDYL